MNSDLRAALRRRKPDKRISPLAPRSRDDLADWQSLSFAAPTALLFDTNVYINGAADRLPGALFDLLDRTAVFHSSVALAELAVGVGNADPRHPSWPTMRAHYAELFDDIPKTRLLTPDPQIWTEAGLIVGTLARTQSFQPHQRKDCLNDALIYLTAARAGLPVLTANRDEFDLIQQLAPEGRFIHY